MKNGVEYRDVAKEIVNIFAKYEATVKDVERIVGWLDDEMKVQPVHECTVKTTTPHTVHLGFAQSSASIGQSFQQ